MFFEDFEDSLDHLLADLTASQLDPSLKSGQQRSKSIETQTDCTFGHNFTNLKRKLDSINTHKHNHQNHCLHHKKCQNKRTKSSDSEMIGKDLNEFNDENERQINSLVNDVSDGNTSSQLVLMSNKELNRLPDIDIDVQNDDNSSKDLFNDWDLLSEPDFDVMTDKSIDLLETDDEIDVRRTPLSQLSGNSIKLEDKPTIRSSQELLICDEELLFVSKSQNSSEKSV